MSRRTSRSRHAPKSTSETLENRVRLYDGDAGPGVRTKPPAGLVRKAKQIREKAVNDQDARLAAAVDVWLGLTQTIRRSLTLEIIETRARELRLAYPELVMLGHGFRKARPKGLGTRYLLTDEPCVIFTVARKHTPSKSTVRRGGGLPPYLLCYVEAPRSKRSLCAVPTDIRTAREFSARPHGAIKVHVDSPSLPGEKGQATCVVSKPGDAEFYALSCHHVFAMSKSTTPRGSAADPVDISVRRMPRPRLGLLDRNWIGRLVPGGESFDAALCSVKPGENGLLDEVCGEVRTRFTTTGPDAVPMRCVLLLEGKSLVLEYVAEHIAFDRIRYFPSGPQPVQPRVLEFQVVSTGLPVPGDSGGAILNEGRTEFVAMHIAGAGRRTFALGAYELLNGDRYGGQSGTLRVRHDF